MSTKKQVNKKPVAKKAVAKKIVTTKTATKKAAVKKQGSVQVQRSAHRDQRFFTHLAQTGRPLESAKFAGYSRSAVYKRKKEDPEFAERWGLAKEGYLEKFEKFVDKRALKGYKDPVFQRGVKVGSRRKYSDTLAIIRLKALAPEKYCERQRVDQTIKHNGKLNIGTPVINLTLNGDKE